MYLCFMLTYTSVLIFMILVFLIEIMGTISGFGSSILFVPIASLFLDFYTVLGLTAIFHVLSNLVKLLFFHTDIHKNIVIKMGIPAVILVAIGAGLSRFVEEKILIYSLSFFLIFLSLFLIFFKNFKLQANLKTCFFAGSLSGFFAGLLGTGGAIRGLALSIFNLEKNSFIATSAFIDLGVDTSRTLIYWWNGFITLQNLWLLFPLFLVSMAGTFLGKKIVHLIPQQHFKQLVLWLIFCTGIFSFFKNF